MGADLTGTTEWKHHEPFEYGGLFHHGGTFSIANPSRRNVAIDPSQQLNFVRGNRTHGGIEYKRYFRVGRRRDSYRIKAQKSLRTLRWRDQ